MCAPSAHTARPEFSAPQSATIPTEWKQNEHRTNTAYNLIKIRWQDTTLDIAPYEQCGWCGVWRTIAIVWLSSSYSAQCAYNFCSLRFSAHTHKQTLTYGAAAFMLLLSVAINKSILLFSTHGIQLKSCYSAIWLRFFRLFVWLFAIGAGAGAVASCCWLLPFSLV